ncbi:MAG: Tetratricopeptide (TPR) repeat [Pelagibacterales bacterium]|jgi:tetratricopeptide (TPR) repeat protein|nr:Tetratricopeptide (TPR) repeat [Pelagibacterales bacterium]
MELLERLKILNNHLQGKNYNKVIEGCNKVLKANPNIPYALNLCGLAQQGKNNFLLSISFFTRAINLEPRNIAAINNLANSYKFLTKIDLAEKLYLKALALDPNYIQALNNYGNLKQQIGDFDSSIELYLKALNINSKQKNIMFSLASAYQELGNFEKSKEIVDKILFIEPSNTSAHKLLSGMIKYTKNNDHLIEMENLLKDKSLREEQIVDLSFALGKAFEDIGDYEKAYKNLERGNHIRKTKVNSNINNQEKLFNSIIKTFENIDFTSFKKKAKDKRIIFICGMPRSGTTLVEQIIASHKDVNGAGELIYLQNSIEKNFVEDFKLNKQKITEEALSSKNLIENEYLELLDLHKYSSKIITDKAPQNFRWIGLMKIFFPNCKIIHCNRDAKDNCLSIFKNNFPSTHMNWSFSQKDIADYYNLYFKLMNFWNSKIPNEIYNANYENIVKDKETEIKKIIQFCDLEWDPSCLNHHKNNKTPISTVSVAQARKPIYTSSLNSNNNYTKYLSELFGALNN